MKTVAAYGVARQGGAAEPFSYQRALGAEDVLVRVTHCSIARGDVQCIDNDWGDTRYPVVPGHEIVGVVEEAGASVVGLRAGDRVGIGYQQAACFACELCPDGFEQLCPAQKVIGVDCHAGSPTTSASTAGSRSRCRRRSIRPRQRRCCHRASPFIQPSREPGCGKRRTWRSSASVEVLSFTDVNRAIETVRHGRSVARTVLARPTSDAV